MAVRPVPKVICEDDVEVGVCAIMSQRPLIEHQQDDVAVVKEGAGKIGPGCAKSAFDLYQAMVS